MTCRGMFHIALRQPAKMPVAAEPPPALFFRPTVGHITDRRSVVKKQGAKARGMPRIVKHPQERRSELLEAARGLFFERGYEATTINDIIARAGISKGGFYHHFASKEDVLEALAEAMARESLAQLQAILDEPGLDALGRLNAFLGRARRLKVEQAPAIRAMFYVIFRPGNLVLYHRLNAAVGAVTLPALARIIAQGREEGVFDVPDVQAVAEIILALGTSTHDAVARAVNAADTPEGEAAAAALDERLRMHGIALDRILGLPDGSVRFVEPGFAKALMAPA